MSESFRVHLFHICILLPGCLLYKNAETTSANPVSSFTICDVTNRRVETMRGITTPVFTLLAFSALINDCWCRECYIFIHGTVSYRCRRTCFYILVLRYIKSWPTLQKKKIERNPQVCFIITYLNGQSLRLRRKICRITRPSVTTDTDAQQSICPVVACDSKHHACLHSGMPQHEYTFPVRSTAISQYLPTFSRGRASLQSLMAVWRRA